MFLSSIIKALKLAVGNEPTSSTVLSFLPAPVIQL
jgi:hypothetical protein